MANFQKQIKVVYCDKDGRIGWAPFMLSYKNTHYPSRETAQDQLVRQLIGSNPASVDISDSDIRVYYDFSKLNDKDCKRCAGLPVPVLMVGIDKHKNFMTLGKTKMGNCFWFARNSDFLEAMKKEIKRRKEAQQELEKATAEFLKEYRENDPPAETPPPGG